MYQPISLFIAVRYIRGKGKDRFGQFISWLSSIGIMLGVMALIIVFSVMNGLEQEIQKNTLYYMPQALITSETGKINTVMYPKQQFEQLKHVTAISPLIVSDVILQSNHNITMSRLLGVDPQETDPIVPFVYGESLSALEAGQYQVIIGYTLANQLGVEIGDQVRLMVTSTSQITPLGRIPSQRLFTVVGIFMVNNDVDSGQVYTHQQDAARLMHYQPDQITGWRLYLDDPLAIQGVIAQLLPDSLIFKDWREQKGDFFQAVLMEKKMMGVLISLIIIVAAFNMIVSLGLLVMEKQGEVAILQTLGLPRRKIMFIFMVLGASSGIIGTLIGSFLGILATYHLDAIRSFLGLSLQGVSLPIRFDSNQLIFVILFSIIIALIATFYPAWRAAKTQPAEALRYE